MTYSIHQQELGPMENFIYFIQDKATKEIALVDPAWDVEAILQKIKELDGKLSHILLTHSHPDHINGIDGILEKYDVPVHLLKAERDYNELNTPVKLHYGEDKLHLGQTPINFLHTPGHTPGSVCYHIGDHLITGDTMFVYGCGHCRLGGNPHQLFSSLQKLKRLPKETQILPGHNYACKKTSSLQEQINHNPYMMIEDEDKFVSFRTTAQRKTPYQPTKKSD